jgi:hypothetical protein
MLLYEAALVMLFVKHWAVDFVWQTPRMTEEKGQYGKWHGILHSLQHAVCTFLIFVLAGVPFAFSMATLDFITHYHIDWIKMNYGNRDITTSEFWNHLGLDQLAHSLVYLLIVGIFIRAI